MSILESVGQTTANAPRAVRQRVGTIRLSGIVRGIVVATKEMLEETLGRVKKIASDQEMLGVTIVNLANGVSVEAKENCARVAENNRGMRGYQKLRVAPCGEVVDDPEERELSLRRQRSLRLVQDVDALLKAIGEQRYEGLAIWDCSCSDLPPYARRSYTDSMYVAKL